MASPSTTLARVRDSFAPHLAAQLDDAEGRAVRLAAAGWGRRAALLFAADALTTVALDCGWSACDVDLLVAKAADASEIPSAEARGAIFFHATQNPRVLELPPQLALEFHLRLLAAFAESEEVTLWTGGGSSPLECLLDIGPARTSRSVHSVARLTLAGESQEDDVHVGLVHGIPVVRWQRPYAALVLRTSMCNRARAVAFARETAAALAPVFERDMLLERNARRERSLVEASEKRVARIGYDIHDGPLQDVAVLLGDLRLARSELHQRLSGGAERLMDGRLQDLELRAAEADRSLRELSVSLEPKHVLSDAFPNVLRQEVESFERRTGVETLLDANGDYSDLTASQRLALFRVVQEGLTNIREHSDATVVEVSLERTRSSTELRVIDNGNGFDVTRVLIDAARRGRLGLVGMSERIRMLGGRLDIVSRPDQYTELSVSLPIWQPARQPATVEQLAL